MKLKSLILGSVAAAGLSTAGYAADLGVLTSLDVCDSLGISGLTLSSSDNCLQITGGVSYEFVWGDYRTEAAVARTFDGNRVVPVGEAGPDWSSKVEAWLQAVGTASSDFGRASATIRLKEIDQTRFSGLASTGLTNDAGLDGDDTGGVIIDQAFVQVGDTTTIMAGKKASIADLGDDAPFNSFLGLFNSDAIDGKGVGIDGDTTYLGGHVIQVVSEVADGFKVGVAVENLNGNSDYDRLTGGDLASNAPYTHGSLVGVVSYAGEGVTAHVTGAALGILDGTVESWFVHAGATGSFDAFKIRAAVAYWDNFKFNSQRTADLTDNQNVLNALISAEGSFDLFTLSASAEVANVDRYSAVDYTDYGFGGQVGFAVTEGVSLNLGARYFRDDLLDEDTTQVAVQLVAAVTETIKVTGELGGYFGSAIANNTRASTAGVPTGTPAANAPGFLNDSVGYAAAELAWAPGGNFTSSLRGEANTENAYKVTFKAAKEFK
ncbi:porin family protein [Devosia rhizoryzae]|uniref:Porin n=1 Tax=Devosia rhizoryzae TaxID=2774137 RepID=A0ABX7CAX4_9HYPH|nr:hypothetical protein [Devosia rhizoryzae]QQR40948.1 hypothetical protein JI748_08195 [Devosia rhizoryzae]